MKTTLDAKIDEAVERMRLLGLSKYAINDFKREQKINFSEGIGALYWVDNDNYGQFVKDFEEQYNAIVYHCIHTQTSFGDLLAMLYISDNPEEWSFDKNDIKDGYPIAYVKNITDDYCSEFGSIGITPMFGGLMRTD